MSHDFPYSNIVRNDNTTSSKHQFVGEWQVPDTHQPAPKKTKPKPTTPKPEIYY